MAIDPNMISSKANAMSFAIRMTMCFDGDRNKVDYDEAQKLFDFICGTVNLPEVDNGAMTDVMRDVGDLVKRLAEMPLMD